MHRIGNFLFHYKFVLNLKETGRHTNGRFCRYSSSGLTQPEETEFLNVSSVKEIYQRWRENPASVGKSWDSFFRSVSQEDQNQNYRHYERTGGGSGSAGMDTKIIDDNLTVLDMIRSFQLRGHHIAKVDPLGLRESLERAPFVVTEEIPYHHFKDRHQDLVRIVKSEINNDQVFRLPPCTFIGGTETTLPLREIIKRLEEAYCGSFGVETAHLNSIEQCNWIRRKFETPGAVKLSKDLRRLTLARLARATGFEAFLTKKYPSVKRFSAEGAETIIPCMKQIIDKSTEVGVECFIIGMAHRARLNIVANVCRQSLSEILAQFQNLDVKEPWEGDAKYHLGLCLDRLNKVTNKNVRVVMLANPSHLECVASLVQGRTRAEQFFRGDNLGKKVLSIQVHGDAAMSGQGVVYEVIQMTDLPYFTTRGVVHIALNNQVGFTTSACQGRSTPYCTDVGKMVDAPVIHVNGDDPDAVVYAACVAAEWRATFRKDIYLDLVMYRKQGHNEGDEPSFTQPVMYTKINQTKPILEIYKNKLVDEGLVSAKEVQDVLQKYDKICEESFEAAKKEKVFNPRMWLDAPWKGFFKNQKQEIPPTGISEELLVQLAKLHSSPAPQGFPMHKGYDRIFKIRMDLINKKALDFSLAEACAFGSMLKEGIHVRAGGQDFPRAAFSHRHYTFHHQTQENTCYTPLSHIASGQAVFEPVNAPLSEFSVLGFEMGYSQTNPNQFNLWEAQFGDFQNTAQCIFDCFICCSEPRWLKQSGLVMSLPHGLEGMGPDHSSARPERFLLQVVDDYNNIPTGPDAAFRQLKEANWIVAHVTTPANLFHIFRRQVKMPFRKPLVSFSPKSLLRLPVARSPFDDFKEGTSFQRVIPDPVPPAGVKKVVFSCGKVYYDFANARKMKKLQNEIAIVRIEQVSPFPYDLVQAEAAKYPNAKICFGQEEHFNQGYHQFVIPRLQKALPGKEIKLITRSAAAGGASGFPATHTRQLKKLYEDFINA